MKLREKDLNPQIDLIPYVLHGCFTWMFSWTFLWSTNLENACKATKATLYGLSIIHTTGLAISRPS